MRLAGVALATVFSCACYCTARIVQRPAPPQAGANAPAPVLIRDIVALLADPETGKVGRVIVSVPVGGPVELHDKRTGVRVVAGNRPSVVFRLSEDQVQQLFGEALAARPPAPRHFLLYFATGSTQLTQESERRLTEILAFVKNRSVPDVTVVGHTDTTGAAQANIELGRVEATLIRDRLVAAGLDSRLVSVDSHGEADLLVPTPDNTANQKNRRVDVTVH